MDLLHNTPLVVTLNFRCLKLFFVIYIYVCTRPVNLIAISYFRIFHELIIDLIFQHLYIYTVLIIIYFV